MTFDNPNGANNVKLKLLLSRSQLSVNGRIQSPISNQSRIWQILQTKLKMFQSQPLNSSFFSTSSNLFERDGHGLLFGSGNIHAWYTGCGCGCGHLMSDLTKLNLIPSLEAPILAKKTCSLPPLSFSPNTLPYRFDFNFLLVKSDGCYMWANT